MDTSTPHTLSPEFWAEFAERYWERAPLVIERPFAQPIASSREVFDAVVDASRASLQVRVQRHANRIPRVRFFIDGAALMTDIGEHLPEERDGHPDGYFARVARQLDGRPFELVVNELQEHSFTLWSRLRCFLRGLYRHVGLPAARADAVAFLRRQERTSFGVHRDDASVFMFVLAGTKRILAWPESAMRGREHILMTRQYHRFRDEAIVLEGKPGDIIYWPSSHWHIGESDGSPSVSLNVSLIQWPPSMDVLRQLSQVVQRRVASSIDATWPIEIDDLAKSARAVPEAMRASLRVAREVASDANLERYLEFTWLKRVTAAGFLRVPPPQEASLAHDDVVRVVPGEPLVMIPFGPDQIACSVAGHAFVIATSTHVSRMLERLDRREPLRVGSLLRACIDEGEPHDAAASLETLLEVLTQMLRLRAITRVS